MCARHWKASWRRVWVERGIKMNLSSAKGMVYFIQAEGHDLFKIGYTASSLTSRLKSLQTGCPHKLVVFEGLASDNAEALEKEIHTRLAPYRQRGEWFAIDKKAVLELVWEYKGKPPNPIKLDKQWYVAEWCINTDETSIKPFHLQTVEQMLQRNLRDAVNKQNNSAWIPIGFFETIEEAGRFSEEVRRAWLLRRQKDAD